MPQTAPASVARPASPTAPPESVSATTPPPKRQPGRKLRFMACHPWKHQPGQAIRAGAIINPWLIFRPFATASPMTRRKGQNHPPLNSLRSTENHE